MAEKKRLKLLIFIGFTAILSYFVWDQFIHAIILNNTTRTVEIRSLKSDRHLKLKKLKNQGNITSIEIEIQGKSKENLVVFLGASQYGIPLAITLKKGKINYEYAADWYDDEFEILLPKSADPSTTVKIDYRFISE